MRVIFIVLLFSCTLFPQLVYLQESAPKDGICLNRVRSNSEGMRLTLTLNRFRHERITIAKQEYSHITVDDITLPNEAGMPDLPLYTRYIVVPEGADVQISDIETNYREFDSIVVSPAPFIPVDSDDKELEYPSRRDYPTLYPQEIISISEPFYMRGYRIVALTFSPFQYDSKNQRIKACNSISCSISFSRSGAASPEARLRNAQWDAIVASSVINPEIMDSISQSIRQRDTDGCQYLIISPDQPAVLEQAERIRKFRNEQGIHTKVVTLKTIGGNEVSAIKDYIHNAYKTWNPAPSAVLMIGDYGTDSTSIIMPKVDDYCYSDNPYGDIDGDALPEIIMARIPINTPEELERIVDKIIKYELNPVLDSSFYSEPLVSLGWQSKRWFQIFGEVIFNFLKSKKGLSPQKFYAYHEGTVADGWCTEDNAQSLLDFFGPDGLNYIQANPGHLSDGDFTADKQDIVDHINKGTNFAFHRDHGGVTGWVDPEFRIESVKSLDNGMLPVIFSVGCLTGMISHHNKTFAEEFIQHPKGAVGIIAATNFSWSWVNDTYGWGMVDYLYQDFLPDYPTTPTESYMILPAFANLYGKVFLKGSSWPINPEKKNLTNALFHYYGDAYTAMHLSPPQKINLTYATEISGDTLRLTVTAPSGTNLGLSEDGEYLLSAISHGETEFIIPEYSESRRLLLTATKRGGIRSSLLIGEGSDNTAPILSSAKPQTIVEDDTLTVELSMTDATDADADPLELLIGEHELYTVEGTRVFFKKNYNGTVQIPLRVTDGLALSNTVMMTVTIDAVNDAPVLEQVIPQVTNKNTPIEITNKMYQAFDVDNETINLKLGVGSNYTLSDTVVIPASDFIGDLHVPLWIEDGMLTSDTLDLRIAVKNGVSITPDSAISQQQRELILFPSILTREDVLQISLSSQLSGMGTLFILDVLGNIVDKQPIVLNKGGSFTWDRKNLNGQEIGSGVYMVVVEIEGTAFTSILGIKK